MSEMTSLKTEQFEIHEEFRAEKEFVDVTVTPDRSEVKEPVLPVEQSNGVSPVKEESSHKYIVLPCTVKVKCGGCGKEAEVNTDDTSPDLTEASYICDICKSRAQKKLRLHQLINGGNFAQEAERTEPKRKHPCPHCSKEFNSLKDMKRHTNVHTGLKPYTCETCGKAFSQSCSLKRHLVTHTDVKPHRCNICGLTFKGHLARHMRSHTGEKPFTCEICQKGFYRSELLKRHLAEHMTDGSVSCSKSQLDDIFQRSLTKQHTCLICDKTYSNSGHLARHMKQHNNENVLRCGVCTKVFYVKEELQEHLQGHSKEDLAAIIAGTLIPTLTNGSPSPSTEDEAVEAPMEEEPNQEDSGPLDLPPQDMVPEGKPEEHACLEDRVTCGICGHACCCTNYIPLHMESHEETMIQCHSCGMDFAPTNGSQICNLCKSQDAEQEAGPETDDIKGEIPEDHQEDGSESFDEDEEKRHKCLECGKSYKYIKHLREHARIHAGGYRPYRCNTCGKSFTKRYHLNRHQLIHARLQRQQSQSRTMAELKPTVGRPLQNIVMKPRVGRPRLSDSRLTETKPVVPVKQYQYVKPKVQPGGMPFVCSACGKGFPKRVPLKRHLLNHLHNGTIPKDHPQLDEMKVNSYVNAHAGDASSPQLQTCPICSKVCKGLHLQRHMKVHSQEEIDKYKETGAGASPETQQQQQRRRPKLETSSGPAPGEMVRERDIDENLMDGEDSEEMMMAENYGPVPDIKDISLVLGEGKPEEVKEHECLDDKVTCGICGHSCCCANYIPFHMETHNEESDKCGKCGKELGDLPSTYVKGGRICSICASRSRKQMRLHQILHKRFLQQEVPGPLTSALTKKRFECQHCPKSFTDRKYYREHLRIHTGEKRYHCSFCGMAFAHSRNFKRHVWRHTGEKPNWCNICNKGIAGHLARHMRSHSAEKSYVCNMCHKGFNRSEHLKRHLKTHLGTQEEFQCHLCPKKYLRKEHLKRHIRSHRDGTLELPGGPTSNSPGSAVKPVHPPVNDQPYREHPCTYDGAACGLCGDACCCANYLPFHMEVHGEKAEDYIQPDKVKKEVLTRQDGFVEKKVRDHSCTFDPVTCGLCGEVCCCANYIPLHMELHGERAIDHAKDHIIKKVEDGVIPFHMEQHDRTVLDHVPQDDILKKALEASEIGDNQVRPHPCLHEIVNCGICGEPCCCANYIRFHLELHTEIMDQEPIIQEEVVCVANPESPTDHGVNDSTEFFPEVEASVEDPEIVGTPEAVADQGADVSPEATEEQLVTSAVVEEHFVNSGSAVVEEELVNSGSAVAEEQFMNSGSAVVEGQLVNSGSSVAEEQFVNNGSAVAEEQFMNNGCAVVEEHMEEFDWASVANFLQGTREPDPLPVPPLLASGSNMVAVNGSPVKEEPTVSHVDESQVTDHECTQCEVTCETCGDILCCINSLIPHLETHKVLMVRCEICQQDVEITKTVSVQKDGTKIYKCGTCVMGVSSMSPSPSKVTQVRVGEPRGVVDKSIQCPHCPRVLKCRKDYTRHVKIHAEVKPYKCDICSKEFTAMANLRRHLDAHAGVKPHECKICGQFFSGHMARHMRTHTGEKKYSCEICFKGFHRLEHLKRHLGQHLRDGSTPSDHKQLLELGITLDSPPSSEPSPSKPNWCDICKKIIPGRLARHMMTHSDVKPFQCSHCEKAFYRSEHLKRHLEVHARRGELHVGAVQSTS